MPGYWWSAPFASWWTVQAVTGFNAPAAVLVPGQVTRTLAPAEDLPASEHDRCALMCARGSTRTRNERGGGDGLVGLGDPRAGRATHLDHVRRSGAAQKTARRRHRAGRLRP